MTNAEDELALSLDGVGISYKRHICVIIEMLREQ